MLPNPALEWYYQYSEADLGLRSSPLRDGPAPTSPSQNWPSRFAVRSATRQKAVREALRQLSPTLQSVIEACYLPSPSQIPLQLKSEFGIAAGAVNRALQHSDEAKDPYQLRRIIALVGGAHAAFEMCYRGGV